MAKPTAINKTTIRQIMNNWLKHSNDTNCSNITLYEEFIFF